MPKKKTYTLKTLNIREAKRKKKIGRCLKKTKKRKEEEEEEEEEEKAHLCM